MTKKSDWTGGLTREELAPATTPEEEKTVVAKMVYVGDESEPSANLSNARAVKEAQCPPSGIRHGWHPNLP